MLKRVDVFPVGDEIMYYEALNALQVCSIFYDLDLARCEIIQRPEIGIVFYMHYKIIDTVADCLKSVLKKIV